MEKYNNLLSRIAERYGIERGSTDPLETWKSRLIYSVAGQMGLASLWDASEDGAVSIVHMKRRMTDILEVYCSIFPEVRHLFSQNLSEISAEIYDVFIQTGMIYHRSEHVARTIPFEAVADDIRLCRGYLPGTKGYLSGLGMYSENKSGKDGKTVPEMFCLADNALGDRWKQIISDVQWISYEDDIKTEYLLMERPYTRGYWTDQPYHDGRISILRTMQIGTRRYFLYRVDNGKVIVHPLPEWQTRDYGYRAISNACLAANGTLPAIKTQSDGVIVHISFEYLPPPAELNFVKLYSWPESMYSQPCNFRRVCSQRVFRVIQSLLSQQGYEFSEE